MNEELLARLDLLAEKAGMLGTDIWQMYLDQVPVYFVRHIGAALLFLLPLYFVRKAWRHAPAKDDHDSCPQEISKAVAVISLTIIALASSQRLYWALTCIVNPEYVAYRTLLEHLR